MLSETAAEKIKLWLIPSSWLRIMFLFDVKTRNQNITFRLNRIKIKLIEMLHSLFLHDLFAVCQNMLTKLEKYYINDSIVYLNIFS